MCVGNHVIRVCQTYSDSDDRFGDVIKINWNKGELLLSRSIAFDNSVLDQIEPTKDIGCVGHGDGLSVRVQISKSYKVGNRDMVSSNVSGATKLVVKFLCNTTRLSISIQVTQKKIMRKIKTKQVKNRD
jgi:hypothetical protein